MYTKFKIKSPDTGHALFHTELFSTLCFVISRSFFCHILMNLFPQGQFTNIQCMHLENGHSCHHS